MSVRTALYWSLTALLLLAVNQFVLTSTHYRGKVDRVDRHFQAMEEWVSQADAGAPLTLVIGNSYVYNSVWPTADDQDVYKFTVNGMPFDDVLHVIESLPPDWPIERVLVGIGYNEASPIESNGYIYRRYKATNFVSKAWWSLPLVRAHSLTVTMLKLELKCLRTVGRRDCRRREGVADDELPPWARDDGAQRDPGHRRSITQRYREYRPFTASVSPTFGAKLAQLEEGARKRGLSVYAFTAPIVPALRDRLPPQTLSEFYTAIDAAGLPYVDLNLEFGDWPASQFSDATHVDPRTGGLDTSQRILSFVRAGAER